MEGGEKHQIPKTKHQKAKFKLQTSNFGPGDVHHAKGAKTHWDGRGASQGVTASQAEAAAHLPGFQFSFLREGVKKGVPGVPSQLRSWI